MEKIKVLIITGAMSIGGAEKVAADIGLYADRTRYEIHYVSFDEPGGDYEAELQNAGCTVFHFPQPSDSFHAYVQHLRELIATYHYDVIHAHTMFNIGWAMLAGRLGGVPVRVAHSHSALREHRILKVRVYESMMHLLIRGCATDWIGCSVDAGNRLYGEPFFRRRGQLILNGVDTAAFAYRETARQKMRRELGMEDCFVIGHVGHLAEVKNQAFLLDRMPDILKKRPDARLLLLGEGPDRAMLEDKIQSLGLEQAVTMTGNVRNVSDYLSAMDVFAFPSLYEGMPLSIVEVQSNGLPCVISTGVPEDVVLTDLIHPLPLDRPEDWVETICGCTRSADASRYAGQMRESGFDTRTAMEKIYQIYDKAEKK